MNSKRVSIITSSLVLLLSLELLVNQYSQSTSNRALASLSNTSYSKEENNHSTSTTLDSGLSNETKIDESIPKIIYPCLPKSRIGEEIAKIDLEATTKDKQNNTYYALGVYIGGDAFTKLLVKVAENKVCRQLMSTNDVPQFSRYVSMRIARELELLSFSKKIKEAGGKAKFQQLIRDIQREDIEPGLNCPAPEVIWAYEKLGLEPVGFNLKICKLSETERSHYFKSLL